MPLRDRDYVLSREGMIFRVLGYDHPPHRYICDPEYAPSLIFQSSNPKAPRTGKNGSLFYKFYFDEGLRFVRERYPQYTFYSESLNAELVGLGDSQISLVRHPDEKMAEILRRAERDRLLEILVEIVDGITERSRLRPSDFGVFGSILHDFYHQEYSDLDLTVYGRTSLDELVGVLDVIHSEEGSPIRNEFDYWNELIDRKHWAFSEYTLDEYAWHQRRKRIYSMYVGAKAGRKIAVEFEPVKDWDEIRAGLDPAIRVRRVGWVKAVARIVDDRDSCFMPSTYQVSVEKVLDGGSASDVERVTSYVEEYRMQAREGEGVVVAGNLEEVETRRRSYRQIALTYGPRYFDQLLKVLR